MNNEEARSILRKHLENYRKRTYGDLVQLIDEPQTAEIRTANGITYQLEIEVFWDAAPNGDIRVLGSIDDGGLRAFAPLNEGFILAPNGQFVGE